MTHKFVPECPPEGVWAEPGSTQATSFDAWADRLQAFCLDAANEMDGVADIAQTLDPGQWADYLRAQVRAHQKAVFDPALVLEIPIGRVELVAAALEALKDNPADFGALVTIAGYRTREPS